MKKPLHYFVGTSADLSANFYDSNFSSIVSNIALSQFSPTDLQGVFAQLIISANDKNTDVEIIHNYMDNSIGGLIFPEMSTSVFSFEPYSDRVIQHSAYCGDKNIININENFSLAKDYFIKAREVHADKEVLYVKNMDFSKVDALCEDYIGTISAKESKGSFVHRYFGAATTSGSIDYIPELTEDLEKRYFIKGRPGTGKSTFMKRLASAAKDKGHFVECYHCALDINSYDMIVIRDMKLCFFDATSPHEYFPSKSGDEIIDLYSICTQEDTDSVYEKELAELESEYRAFVTVARRHLKQAYKFIDSYNSSYQSDSECSLDKLTQDLIAQLFNKTI